LEDAELVNAFEKGLDVHVREPARAHTKDAIKTLAKLMKGTKTPPNVRRQCAQDLLSQAWGRPDAREDTSGQHTTQGLTVNIIRLFDGSQKTIEVDIEQAKLIAASVDANIQGETPVEAPKDYSE
jgi:hypothetical protein